MSKIIRIYFDSSRISFENCLTKINLDFSYFKIQLLELYWELKNALYYSIEKRIQMRVLNFGLIPKQTSTTPKSRHYNF